MASRLVLGIAAAGLLTSAAAYSTDARAQGVTYWPPSPQPVVVTPAPTPNVSVTRTERLIDANGYQTNRVETYERHDTIGQGSGTLSAVSNSSSQWTTTTVPATVVPTTTYVVPSTVWVTNRTPDMVAVSPVITSTRDEALDRR